MFNCYSGEGGEGDGGRAGSGVAAGQAPQLHFPCTRPASGTTLPPPRTASTFPPRFLSFSPPPLRPHNLFHPSTPHRSPSPFLAATTRPRSLLSAAVSINPPSPTLFNGRAFTPRATVFPAETSFRDPTKIYVFISQGSGWTKSLRLAAISIFVYWILTRAATNLSLVSFFIFYWNKLV